MPVVVVSRVPSLAAALASRLDAVGIEPDDLSAYLQSVDELSGAIVDCTSTDMTMTVAGILREHDPWCPMILLLSGDRLPGHDDTDPLEPVRLVRRPFTTGTVIDHMTSMQRSSSVQRPARVDEPGAVDDAPLAIPDVEPLAPQSRPQERSRWGRRKPAQGRDTTSMSPRDAVRVLLANGLPPPVSDAAEEIVQAVATLVTAETAIAVLVLEDHEWVVEAGRGLRPNEMRVPIGPSHWLTAHVKDRDTAVVVSGTDVARQELTNVPLIHLEYWMATTMHQSSVMVIVARGDKPEFEVADAVTLTDALHAHVRQLVEAQQLRALARRLLPYL